MHNGIALSLLDFLLVTAMLLLTPNDEWMNVTRPSQSKLDPDSGSPYDSSFSHEPSDMKPILLASESAPAIERWRSTKSSRVVDDNRSDCGESSDDETTLSRATSRLSFHTETQSTAQHSTYPSEQGVYATRSDSSLSLAMTFPRSGRGRTRELPVPPIPHPYGPSGPSSASSYVSHVAHLPPSQDQPPPIPFLLGSSSTPPPPHDVRPHVINSSSVFSRHVAGSPTSIHSRSLPIPPTPSASKPRLPLLPPASPADSASISPISALPSPVQRRPSLSRTYSHSHLRSATTSYPDSPHNFMPQVKAPPNYTASTPSSPPLPISARTSVQRGGMSLSLSIRTTDVAPMLRSAPASNISSDTSFASGEPDPFDMPPAYSVLDAARSSTQLQTVNGEMGQ